MKKQRSIRRTCESWGLELQERRLKAKSLKRKISTSKVNPKLKSRRRKEARIILSG